MKPTRYFCSPISLARIVVLPVVIFLLSSAAYSQTTITGTVYDKQRNALPDIDVELLDNFNRLILNGGRTRTDGTGRYQFTGLADGNYTIRVYAFRYDLEDQEQRIEVFTSNARGGPGVGFETRDFYRVPKGASGRGAECDLCSGCSEVPSELLPRQRIILGKRMLRRISVTRTPLGSFLLFQGANEIRF